MMHSLHPRLDAKLGEIELILDSHVDRAQRVGSVMANLADATEVLDGLTYTFDSRNYGRGLVYGDPNGRFSILALIWHPGHVTPLHAHQTWCAVTMLSGELTETTYEFADRMPVEPTLLATRSLTPGDISCDAGDGLGIHRIANDSQTLAISLHVYGVPAHRIDNGINIVIPDARKP